MDSCGIPFTKDSERNSPVSFDIALWSKNVLFQDLQPTRVASHRKMICSSLVPPSYLEWQRMHSGSSEASTPDSEAIDSRAAGEQRWSRIIGILHFSPSEVSALRAFGYASVDPGPGPASIKPQLGWIDDPALAGSTPSTLDFSKMLSAFDGGMD